MKSEFLISPLGESHDISVFNSSEPDLNPLVSKMDFT